MTTRRPIPLSGRRAPLGTSLAAAVSVAMLASGCQLLNPDPGSDTLEEFLSALDDGNVEAAAGLTTDPESALPALSSTFESFATADVAGMDVLTPDVESDNRTDEGPVTVEYEWLPEDPEHEVRGTGEVTLVPHGDDWRVEWSPSVLDTRASDDAFVGYQTINGYDVNVVNRNGDPLWVWADVTAVTLSPAAEPHTDALVAALQGAVPTLTPDDVRENIDTGEGAPIVTLRDEDFDPIAEELRALGGVTLTEQRQMVRADPALSSPALSELPAVVDDILAENAGWSVGVFNPGEEEIRLTGEDPTPGEDLVSTLDPAVHQAAMDTVNASPYATSIVAIRPSTGEVLSVAQNSAADAQGAVATQGLFPPGSTFKVVTTAAALDTGVVAPDEILPCPESITVAGRTIPNNDDIGFGDVQLGTAVSESCNTTQAVLAERLGDDDIRDTAHRLGVGVEREIPGLTVSTDTVPSLPQGPSRVESAIGQGEILSNPFGQAVMMASLANDGTAVRPSVIEGMPATGEDQAPLSPETVSALRGFLGQAVQSGTATDAAGIPGLEGKTGTAEVGDGDAHGWFAGIQGDLAFAVLAEHSDRSTEAVRIAAQFLGSAPG